MYGLYGYGYTPEVDDVVWWEDRNGERKVGVIISRSSYMQTCGIIDFFGDSFDIEMDKLSRYHDYHNHNRCVHATTSFIGIAGAGYHVCVMCDERV